MLTMLDISSENVVALRADGTLDEGDVARIADALDDALAAHERIRVYFETGEVLGITPRGLWEDIRYGVRRFRDLASRIERVALVTDKAWLRTLAELEGKLFPAVEERAFPLADREEALGWIAQPTH